MHLVVMATFLPRAPFSRLFFCLLIHTIWPRERCHFIPPVPFCCLSSFDSIDVVIISSLINCVRLALLSFSLEL
ncbi:hypothetical protein B0O99DRAFT_660572 [Bisporella sp. PMI_857]|nr:hypothetical protein B0O99DRAFT_660572 [Bisporella sp. PMI_857]